MSRQVIWTLETVQNFKKYGNLTDFQYAVLETRISGMTQVSQAYYFSVSLSVIKKTISDLKVIYDKCQREHPELFNPRRNNVYEKWLDEN